MSEAIKPEEALRIAKQEGIIEAWFRNKHAEGFTLIFRVGKVRFIPTQEVVKEVQKLRRVK